MSKLGRIAPPDWKHVDKYPLSAAVKAEITDPRPVVIGVNWYPEFDEPVKDSRGYYWIARQGISSRSRPRGGHSVCLKPRGRTDYATWWDFYNQQNEGICVSEAVSRSQTQNNRKMYQPRWVYDRCKERDGIPNEEGTFVRTGFEVIRDKGLVPRKRGEAHVLTPHALDSRAPVAAEGVSAYRWVRSIQDALDVLGYGDLDFVDVINSWGRDYPHLVRMPASVLARLWNEDGEIGVATDR